MPIIWFEECDESERVGGKAAGLGSLLRAGIRVPPGFAVGTDAFAALLEGGLGRAITSRLVGVENADTDELEEASDEIRLMIEETPVPPTVADAVRRGYASLCRKVGVPEDDLPVAVRSSATAEDLPDASFAGQQDTFLWVIGADDVVTHLRRCWSSLYTARAISYRIEQGYPHDRVLMSVCVQQMVDARTSGVMFTLNPINGDRSKVAIDASWGLGEAIVAGEVTPDHFLVDKVAFEIVRREISPKTVEFRPNPTGRMVERREVPPERAHSPSLADIEILELTRLARAAEAHHGRPQDLEWAIDGRRDGPDAIFLLQSRPETVWAGRRRRPISSPDETTLDHIVANLLRGVRVREGRGGRTM